MKQLSFILLLMFPIVIWGQSSGGQITRKKQNTTNVPQKKMQDKRKRYLPNEVIVENSKKTIIFETTQAVDLGLPSGTIWGGWNIGANSPKDIGEYFAWGEIVSKDEYIWENYFDVRKIIDKGSKIEFKQYYLNGSTSIIGTERDVASIKWGKPWRMPSKAQIEELVTCCSFYMVKFPEKSERYALFMGPNGKSILFPVSGRINEKEKWWGELCWSGELTPQWNYDSNVQNSFFAWVLEVYSSGAIRVERGFRLHGMNVRAVK